jgi:hypothetical protein
MLLINRFTKVAHNVMAQSAGAVTVVGVGSHDDRASLSFLKIISGRSDDVTRTGLVW